MRCGIVAIVLACTAVVQVPREVVAQVAPAETYETKLKALAQTIGTLTPQAAAEQWLAMADWQAQLSAQGMQQQFGDDLNSSSVPSLLTALPSPEQWPAVAEALAKRVADHPQSRRDLELQMLFAALQNDRVLVKDLLTRLTAMPNPARQFGNGFMSAPESLQSLLGINKDAVDTVALFEAMLIEENRREIDLPDLVKQLGVDKARVLIGRALLSNLQIDPGNDDATAKFAREIALEQIAALPRPQWSLCCSPDALVLYEAMLARFPAKVQTPAAKKRFGIFRQNNADDEVDEHEFERQRATQFYLLALLKAGRNEEALALAKSFKPDRFGGTILPYNADEFTQGQFAPQTFELLKQLASDDPSTPLWPKLLEMGARLKRSGELIELAKSGSQRQDLTPEQKSDATLRYAQALLAADRFEEGAATLQLILDEPREMKQKLELALSLATVGRLSDMPKLQRDGLDWASILIKNMPKDSSPDYSAWLYEMKRAQRLPEVLATLQPIVDASTNPSRGGSQLNDLTTLALACYHANRPVELMKLFDTNANWSSGDVGGVTFYNGSHSETLSFYAAWGLAKTGKLERAREVLANVLRNDGSLDAALALLVEISPDPAAELDALFARDQFEERPLIWKATLLHKAGKLKEAEALCRQAIAIDPSDGEQGKGDRMRVYSVLADVLDAQGNAKDAAFFREVVTSIRMSEDADDAWKAGLLDRAITMYETALTHFADAYCIQSRLAIQLAEMGKWEEAQKHYQRAYELMPDSFGRIESHCFGCEGAFRSDVAKNIADQTFTRLLVQSPQKPQLHYLLGYLREAQGRNTEALACYHAAVKLDPKYFNAWKKILGLRKRVPLTPEQLDAATIAVLELDPLGRHGSEVHAMQSPAQLWPAAVKAAAMREPRQKAVYALSAAAKRAGSSRSYTTRTTSTGLTPGQIVCESELPAAVLQQISPY